MAINQDIKEKVATNWEYLETMRKAYEGVINSNVNYARSLQEESILTRTRIHPISMNELKKDFCAKLYNFFIAVNWEFKKYMRSEDLNKDFPEYAHLNISIEDFQSLYITNHNPEKLFAMYEIVSAWAQKLGLFRTLNEIRDPGKAIMYGGR